MLEWSHLHLQGTHQNSTFSLEEAFVIALRLGDSWCQNNGLLVLYFFFLSITSIFSFFSPYEAVSFTWAL